MQQLTPEQRLLILEADVAKIKEQLAFGSDVDRALLARVDQSISDIHRLERETANGFASLRNEIRDVKGQMESNDSEIIEVLKDHKAYMEEMREEFKAGQQQIISLLAGGTRRDD